MTVLRARSVAKRQRASVFALALAALLFDGCRTVGNNGSLKGLDPSQLSGDLNLVGYVPARYVSGTAQSNLMLNRPGGNRPSTPQPSPSPQNGQNRPTRANDDYVLSVVGIKTGVIQSISPIAESEVDAVARQPHVLVLKRDQARTYDVIYPGMINLHNHTKQNVLPLWGEAHGQFANRFEWRDYDPYKKAVSNNMNPWVSDKAATCAAFRWSELQAMVLGTTYLQGPSSCIEHFAIHQVEDEEAYLAEPGKALARVQAPTDLVVPDDMPFVWKHVKPLVDQGMTYEEALLQKIKDFCPRMMTQFNIADVNGQSELAVFKDKANVENFCDQTPDKFVRYLYWQHKTIAGKKNYLAEPNAAAVIVHLAEGRRKDPYNRIEFQLLKVFGLDKPHVNLVHAVGLDTEDFKHMAQKNMGLIWSPFSNLLLYGETVDIESALNAGVKVALGSDWTPTGSRGVLEELKIARAYAAKNNLERLISDETLYEMVTENPASLLQHLEQDSSDGRHDIGRIAVDAAASFVVMSRRESNPYTNFVLADAQDIDLVMIDGKPVYGEPSLLKAYDPGVAFESLPVAVKEMNSLQAGQGGIDFIPNTVDSATRASQIAQLAKNPDVASVRVEPACNFTKGFVQQDSQTQLVTDFIQESGLNLDRAIDIQKLLALNILTQSYNHEPNGTRGDPNFAVKEYPKMFSCDDAAYTKRLSAFISDDEMESNDEVSVNVQKRKSLRVSSGLGDDPKKMAELYGIPYDSSIDY